MPRGVSIQRGKEPSVAYTINAIIDKLFPKKIVPLLNIRSKNEPLKK